MRLTRAAAAAVVIVTAGCGEGPSPPPLAVVTFDVQGERFRVGLTTEEQVAAAQAARAGGPARIPNGRIVAGTELNTGWSWHVEDVGFAEITAEVCDGRPSDVEREGTRFGAGRFCPWSAVIVDLR
jgi:hypothetical protein